MGPTPDDVALALAGSTPRKATLYTAEQKYLDVFKRAAEDRGSRLVATTTSDAEAVTERELDAFQYTEHAENVALALKVCDDLGVSRELALKGMQALEPEVGATRILEVSFYERSLLFVNAFAANDPESTELIWERVVEKYGKGRSLIALVNCRFDRPQRSQQLAHVASQWTPADHYVLMGSGTLLFARAATARGLKPSDITIVEGDDTDEVFETILEQSRRDPLIVGMCNVKGGGMELARFFGNRARSVVQA
jgi:poly-gamma-glutamate synthase PgsB/CapB